MADISATFLLMVTYISNEKKRESCRIVHNVICFKYAIELFLPGQWSSLNAEIDHILEATSKLLS